MAEAVQDGPQINPELTDFQKWDKLAAEQVVIEEKPEAVEAAPAAAAETAPAAAAADDDTEVDLSKEQVSSPVQKRINQLTRKAADLQRKLDAATPAAAAAPAATPAAAAPAAAAPAAAAADGPPKPENFDDYGKYVAALTRYELKQERAETAAEQAKTAAQAEQTRILAEHNARVETAKANHPDWDAKFEAVKNERISPTMMEAIFQSPEGPEMAYQLASNVPEARRIAALPATLQAVEMGKLIGRLSATAAAAPAPAVSRAPAPPQTVAGVSGADLGKEPDPKNFKEWAKWKDRQEGLT